MPAPPCGLPTAASERDGTSRDWLDIRFRDAAIADPVPDPRCPASSSLRIASEGQTSSIDLDCTMWKQRGATRFVYADRYGTAGGVKRVLLAGGRSGRAGTRGVKLAGDNYGNDPLTGPVEFLEVELMVAADGYCGRFSEPASTLRRNGPAVVRFFGPASLPCEAAPTETPTPTPPPTPTPTEGPSGCCALPHDGPGSPRAECFDQESEPLSGGTTASSCSHSECGSPPGDSRRLAPGSCRRNCLFRRRRPFGRTLPSSEAPFGTQNRTAKPGIATRAEDSSRDLGALRWCHPGLGTPGAKFLATVCFHAGNGSADG